MKPPSSEAPSSEPLSSEPLSSEAPLQWSPSPCYQILLKMYIQNISLLKTFSAQTTAKLLCLPIILSISKNYRREFGFFEWNFWASSGGSMRKDKDFKHCCAPINTSKPRSGGFETGIQGMRGETHSSRQKSQGGADFLVWERANRRSTGVTLHSRGWRSRERE